MRTMRAGVGATLLAMTAAAAVEPSPAMLLERLATSTMMVEATCQEDLAAFCRAPEDYSAGLARPPPPPPHGRGVRKRHLRSLQQAPPAVYDGGDATVYEDLEDAEMSGAGEQMNAISLLLFFRRFVPWVVVTEEPEIVFGSAELEATYFDAPYDDDGYGIYAVDEMAARDTAEHQAFDERLDDPSEDWVYIDEGDDDGAGLGVRTVDPFAEPVWSDAEAPQRWSYEEPTRWSDEGAAAEWQPEAEAGNWLLVNAPEKVGLENALEDASFGRSFADTMDPMFGEGVARQEEEYAADFVLEHLPAYDPARDVGVNQFYEGPVVADFPVVDATPGTSLTGVRDYRCLYEHQPEVSMACADALEEARNAYDDCVFYGLFAPEDAGARCIFVFLAVVSALALGVASIACCIRPAHEEKMRSSDVEKVPAAAAPDQEAPSCLRLAVLFAAMVSGTLLTFGLVNVLTALVAHSEQPQTDGYRLDPYLVAVFLVCGAVLVMVGLTLLLGPKSTTASGDEADERARELAEPLLLDPVDDEVVKTNPMRMELPAEHKA